MCIRDRVSEGDNGPESLLCHSLVLCSMSPWLCQYVTSSSCHCHKLELLSLHLPGVRFSDVKKLLDAVYQGLGTTEDVFMLEDCDKDLNLVLGLDQRDQVNKRMFHDNKIFRKQPKGILKDLKTTQGAS